MVEARLDAFLLQKGAHSFTLFPREAVHDATLAAELALDLPRHLVKRILAFFLDVIPKRV